MDSHRLAQGLRRRVLFIDAFDSFTNNIIGMLVKSTNAEITKVHINDDNINQNLEEILCAFDAVVVGPGPGHPSNPTDVGVIEKLWKLSETSMIPVLGICLGFQSLCLHHGAGIRRLHRPRHGIVTSPTHQSSDIFSGIGELEATQYHSLHAILDENNTITPFWQPSRQCPFLRPLAWDLTDDLNGPILMGVRHSEKPFWGVQFHPESICTSEAGKELVVNWWHSAQRWLAARHRLLVGCWERQTIGADATPTATCNRDQPSRVGYELRSALGSESIFLRWGKHSETTISPTTLVEALGLGRDEVLLLDSQGHTSGSFSILGVVVPGKTMRITYNVLEKVLKYGADEKKMHTLAVTSIDETWPILQEALDLHNPRQEHASRASTPGPDILHTGLDGFVAGHLPGESPFWGGFMGYISYEAGLETIDVDLHESCAASDTPDINFAFIHRSIVIDHKSRDVFIQSLLPGDWPWILSVGRMIDDIVARSEPRGNLTWSGSAKEATQEMLLTKVLNSAQIERPTENAYRKKILHCQDFLLSGDSYELCLTDETEIRFSNGQIDPWLLYKRLRKKNPAPFGAFFHLSDIIIVGSSPERFLKWSRDGHCQFRPIKGTVKKSPDMTRDMAYETLGSSKERAENLMIVDLIRHDLCGVVGPHNSWVSKLMVVEEYETVYQLVSVIEGQLPDRDLDPTGPRGIHVLKASLPPGSMTGAPKKRSCEILRDIERRPRGVYAGVLGYMDIGGSGDFSVVIRTAVRSGDQMVDWRNSHPLTSGQPHVDQGQPIQHRTEGIQNDMAANGARSSFVHANGNNGASVHDNGIKINRNGISCIYTNGRTAGTHSYVANGNDIRHNGTGVYHYSNDGRDTNVIDIRDMDRVSGEIHKMDFNHATTKGDMSAGISGRTETWRIGAGGAVTVQSTDEYEFLEMETKASSVLGALFPKA
jgi:para-aminobenzoate synthetase